MKFRPHRGGLEDAMKEVIAFETRAAFLRFIRKTNIDWCLPINDERITVEPYGYDDRIKWDTHIVCIDGRAVGFTDGPMPDK